MSTEQKISRVQKKDISRSRLIEVATRLFLENGFDNTTIDMIVAEVGISQRTFFRYFPTKFDVAFPYHKERLYEFRTIYSKYNDSKRPFHALRLAITDFASYFNKQGERLSTEWRMATSSAALLARDMEQDTAFENVIYDRMKESGVAEVDARIYAGAIFGGINATVGEWLKSGCRSDLVTFGAPLLLLFDRIEKAFESGVKLPNLS